MNKEDGVIKFQMEYAPAEPLSPEQLREINAWRKITYLLQLIGQTPCRYGGYGFGNISRRLAPFDAPHAYGTPEMAAAVRSLFARTRVRERLIFSMGGHEDGVVSFGRTA